MSPTTFKVAILHQGFIPHYRVRFYQLLNQLDSTAQYVVFHGNPASNSGWTAADGPFEFPNRWVKNRELHIGKWLALYQPVVHEIMAGRYDAVVLGHEVKFISNILLALMCKVRNIPILYWGFGYHTPVGFGFTSESRPWASWLAASVKNQLTRLAEGYMTYTKGGAERLAAIGFPPHRIFVLQNTIDTSAQCQLHDKLQTADPQVLREALGLQPHSAVLLYIGRLLESKQIDALIDAVIRINHQANPKVAVEGVIIGSGPLADALRQQAGGDTAIKFLGRVDDTVVARYMKVAAAVVIPGQIGLAINHAFAHGCPVITRNHGLHSPEIEYLSHGSNGLIIDGTFDTFVSTLSCFAASPEWQRRLAEGALHSRDSFRLENMAQQFDGAVRSIRAYARHPEGHTP